MGCSRDARLFGSSGSLRLGGMVRKYAGLLVFVALCVPAALAQHGVQEFNSSATFQVPTGVSSLRIDAYGAGGGGGGSDSSFNGGGGGGGAYTAGAIDVSPGDVLTITVGAGGAGGLAGNPGQAGSPGGSSKILSSTNVVLLSANGGRGGQGATATSNGKGGAGGSTGSLGSIRHAGQNGNMVGGGIGYLPAGYSLIFVQNGVFSTGGQGGSSGANGQRGLPGYILISW